MNLVKPLLTLALLSIFLFNPGISMAQLSKSEKRTWKKQQRKMSPEEFKNLVESREKLAFQADSLQKEASALLTTLQEKEASLNRLKTDQTQTSQELSQLKKQLGEQRLAEEVSPWDKGVAFRVQFGAFKDHDISNLVEDSPDLELVKEDGFIKYVLGQFREYDKADELKRYLRKIGVNETWIVPYMDGKRVPLKDVLDVVLEK